MNKRRIPKTNDEKEIETWRREVQANLSVSNSIAWSIIDKTGSSLADIQSRDHSLLTSILAVDVTSSDINYDKHVSNSLSKGWEDHKDASAPHSGHVDISGDETISGIKTFSSFSITPSSAPTSNYQVTNKKYVDDNDTLLLPLDGTRAMTGNLNFAGFLASLMVCDKGSTLPAAPNIGQWFLHTPTGRNVLMMYNGTDWSNIMSLGTMTIYVDGTNGTDNQDKGTGTGTNAFKTIQYAINAIPGMIGDNVTINITAETYNEIITIEGKNFLGPYAITLKGTQSTSLGPLTMDSGVQGTGATQGSITDTGAFTGIDYSDKWVISDGSGSGYYLIDSNTDNVLTIVGNFFSAPSGSYTIVDIGTTISKTVNINPGQTGIKIENIILSGPVNAILVDGGNAAVTTCKITQRAKTQDYGALELNQTLVQSGTSAQVTDMERRSTMLFLRSKVDVLANSKSAIKVIQSDLKFTQGSIIDGNSNLTGTVGIDATANSGVTCFSSASNGYTRIRNIKTGVQAKTNSSVINTNNIQYSGNTTDESAIATSYGYID